MFQKEGKKTWELKSENTPTPKFKTNEPWNTETHKKDRNPPITYHKAETAVKRRFGKPKRSKDRIKNDSF